MATNFPSSLDDSTTIPVESANTKLSTNHVTAHQNIQDAIEAIESKVGANSSAVTTSHDYKLSEVTDKAVGKTATQTLTNKTLTSPVINLGSDAEGDTYYRNSSGVLTRLARGTDNYILKMNGNVPNWEAEASITDASYAAKGIVQGLTDAATSGLTITAGVISVNSGTGNNNVVKLDSSAKLPAVDGSELTKISPDSKNGVTTREYNAASGTQTIAHGLGRTPKYVKITAMHTSNYVSGGASSYLPSMSTGVYNGSTTATIFNIPTTNGGSTSTDTTNIVYIIETISTIDASQIATCSVDSTNITLTWTKLNTLGNTQTIKLLWEVM